MTSPGARFHPRRESGLGRRRRTGDEVGVWTGHARDDMAQIPWVAGGGRPGAPPRAIGSQPGRKVAADGAWHRRIPKPWSVFARIAGERQLHPSRGDRS